jgi:hypothetical protein
MFQITLDVFSGRENPSMIMEDQEARELGLELSRNRGILTDLNAGYQGLGFRGIIIQPTDDTVVRRYDLPPIFKIASGASANETKAQEIAERLIKSVIKKGSQDAISFSPSFENTMLEMLASPPTSDFDTEGDTQPAPIPTAATSITCNIEVGVFNPGFWNHPANILVNNCYNYACNKRTGTFAQPGRGSGHMYTSLSCSAVTAAAISDGLHHRFDCFPDSEKPRWLVALVVAPGEDYHWYRKQKEGFWGHKPGQTAARNYDNNGNIIYNPETCARRPYTDFCGYFYVPKSQRIN